jgi:hypothetical protein
VRYTVKTKSGKIYKAKSVEVAFGFVTMKFWYGELRLPAGEISSVSKFYLEPREPAPEKSSAKASGGWVIPILLFIIVFIFSLPAMSFVAA